MHIAGPHFRVTGQDNWDNPEVAIKKRYWNYTNSKKLKKQIYSLYIYEKRHFWL